jgi:hypothetical protein
MMAVAFVYGLHVHMICGRMDLKLCRTAEYKENGARGWTSFERLKNHPLKSLHSWSSIATGSTVKLNFILYQWWVC